MHFESGKLMVYKPNYVLLPRPAKLGYSTMLYTMLSRRLVDRGRSSNHLYRAHSMMLKDLIWMSVVRERSSNLRRYASVSWWQGDVIVGKLLLQFMVGHCLPSLCTQMKWWPNLGRSERTCLNYLWKWTTIFYQKIFAGEKGWCLLTKTATLKTLAPLVLTNISLVKLSNPRLKYSSDISIWLSLWAWLLLWLLPIQYQTHLEDTPW